MISIDLLGHSTPGLCLRLRLLAGGSYLTLLASVSIATLRRRVVFLLPPAVFPLPFPASNAGSRPHLRSPSKPPASNAGRTACCRHPRPTPLPRRLAAPPSSIPSLPPVRRRPRPPSKPPLRRTPHPNPNSDELPAPHPHPLR